MKLQIGTDCALSETPIKEIKLEEILHQDDHMTKVPHLYESSSIWIVLFSAKRKLYTSFYLLSSKINPLCVTQVLFNPS